MKHRRSLTLAELVETIQDTAGSDAEAVAILTHMIKTGRVTLGSDAETDCDTVADGNDCDW